MTSKSSPRRLANAPLHVKRRLIPAALSLLMDRDFHQVQVRDIAAESGVSSATIYKYFGSKEGLVIAILEDFLAEIIEDIAPYVSSSGGSKDRLSAVWKLVLTAYDKCPEIAVLYFVTVPTRTWLLHDAPLLREVSAHLSSILDQGRNIGEIDKDLTNTQIIGLFYTMLGREVQIWYSLGQKWNFVSRCDRTFSLFWKSVRAQ